MITAVMVGSVLLFVAVGALVLIMRKKISNKKQEKEKECADANPVYGTYEVTYDPIAEVRNRNGMFYVNCESS